MNATTPAEKIAANNQLDASLAKVLVLTENYPQLKSNQNFLRLQDELAGTENRIAVDRRYNEAVQDYNTYISLFPNSLVASFGGFTPTTPIQNRTRRPPSPKGKFQHHSRAHICTSRSARETLARLPASVMALGTALARPTVHCRSPGCPDRFEISHISETNHLQVIT